MEKKAKEAERKITESPDKSEKISEEKKDEEKDEPQLPTVSVAKTKADRRTEVSRLIVAV